MSLIVLSLLLAGGARADTSTQRSRPLETPELLDSPTVPVATPTATEAISETEYGWEEQALLELADRLGWPANVIVDGTGMFLVQLEFSPAERAQAAIRPFSYITTAEAAFIAEQEDAQLAGFSVEQTQFESYPAYVAIFTEQDGTVSARRLRWRVDQWILGVAIDGTSEPIAALDHRAIGTDLMRVAQQHGLPEPTVVPEPTAVPATPIETPPTSEPASPTPRPTRTLVSCEMNFSDLTSDYWAYDYIMELACTGIVSGSNDGTFRPNNATTRAQIAKMIVLSEGWTLVNPKLPSFTDVSRSNIFYRYIETAYAHGILSGYSNGQFRPDNFVTRAQVAKMLVRARGWTLEVSAANEVPLCDVPSTHWAWIYVQVAIQHGSFNGYPTGCFLPNASATRAQIAKVLVQAQRD